eukprot:TRINITY_DN6272_c0_g1_i1.p2 TRINITY_DN6272_c0_g1~~TRINITY_DN6272_c0_g1_i1.p2  ORF type:complete len:671 (+),score=101.56 TRINITY_DN6272_c0_g1_i1:130-2142(+)
MPSLVGSEMCIRDRSTQSTWGRDGLPSLEVGGSLQNDRRLSGARGELERKDAIGERQGAGARAKAQGARGDRPGSHGGDVCGRGAVAVVGALPDAGGVLAKDFEDAEAAGEVGELQEAVGGIEVFAREGRAVDQRDFRAPGAAVEAPLVSDYPRARDGNARVGLAGGPFRGAGDRRAGRDQRAHVQAVGAGAQSGRAGPKGEAGADVFGGQIVGSIVHKERVADCVGCSGPPWHAGARGKEVVRENAEHGGVGVFDGEPVVAQVMEHAALDKHAVSAGGAAVGFAEVDDGVGPVVEGVGGDAHDGVVLEDVDAAVLDEKHVVDVVENVAADGQFRLVGALRARGDDVAAAAAVGAVLVLAHKEVAFDVGVGAVEVEELVGGVPGENVIDELGDRSGTVAAGEVNDVVVTGGSAKVVALEEAVAVGRHGPEMHQFIAGDARQIRVLEDEGTVVDGDELHVGIGEHQVVEVNRAPGCGDVAAAAGPVDIAPSQPGEPLAGAKVELGPAAPGNGAGKPDALFRRALGQELAVDCDADAGIEQHGHAGLDHQDIAAVDRYIGGQHNRAVGGAPGVGEGRGGHGQIQVGHLDEIAAGGSPVEPQQGQRASAGCDEVAGGPQIVGFNRLRAAVAEGGLVVAVEGHIVGGFGGGAGDEAVGEVVSVEPDDKLSLIHI